MSLQFDLAAESLKAACKRLAPCIVDEPWLGFPALCSMFPLLQFENPFKRLGDRLYLHEHAALGTARIADDTFLQCRKLAAHQKLQPVGGRCIVRLAGRPARYPALVTDPLVERPLADAVLRGNLVHRNVTLFIVE